jgi:predicted Zn finger-like uncharacterized protein
MADALDGNAIGGLLIDVFGEEMTTAPTNCPSCRASALLAGVYLRAPGTVVRCRSCSGVLMVLVSMHGITCVDSRGLAAPRRGPTAGR